MKSVLITGANRGIGLKFVEHYCEAGWQVYATYRSDNQDLTTLCEKHAKLSLLKLDVADPASIEALRDAMNGKTLNLLVNNAGVYGPAGARFGDMQNNIEQWQDVLTVNTIAPHIITETLIDNLLAGAPAKVAFVTSKMGSIGDNGYGNAYIYRSSKAGLNAVIKSIAIDLAEKQITTVALHPGWVKTRMGGDNAIIDTDTSVNGMTKIIDELNSENSGSFVAYDGQIIPW